MPLAAIPILLGSFALGATGGYMRRRGEAKEQAERADRESFIRTAEGAAAAGEAGFFQTPEVQKAMKRFGAEDAIGILGQLASAPLTQEQRAVALQALTASRAKAESETAKAKTETTRQQTVGKIIGGMTARPGEEAGEEPRRHLQAFETASPQTQALISEPGAQATTQMAAIKATQERTQATKEIALMERQTTLEVEAGRLGQMIAELEEKRRTTVSAQDQVALRRDENAIATERNRILATEVEVQEKKLTQADKELSTKIATTIFGEGITAKASKEIADFFTGRISALSEDTAKLAGLSKTTLGNLMTVVKEANDLRKQALKIVDDTITQTRIKGKQRVKMSPEEIQSRVAQANGLLRQAAVIMMQSGAMSAEEINRQYMLDVKVMTDDGEIVTPGVAAGLGLGTKTSIPALGPGVGPGGAGLSPGASRVLERFLKGEE